MSSLPTLPGSPPSVGDLQQALLEAGFTISADELNAETFGPSTTSAVLAFQGLVGLVVDGVPGPKTWEKLKGEVAPGFTAPAWRYDLADVRPGLVEVVKWAVGQVGQVEDPPGSNRGPRIDTYQAPHKGLPWCAYFCSKAYTLSEPPAPFGTIGSVWGLYEWAQRKGRVLMDAQPVEPGDIAVVLRAKRRGHCALVVHVLPDGRLCTVGGNEQNAVRGRVRRREEWAAVIRPIPRP